MSKYKKMKQLIADIRLPEYRYKQLLDAVFLQGIMRFEDMKLLPKTLREKLVEQFGETVVEIKAIHHEKSMQTDKVLFELSDGNRVETVGLFYKEGWNSFCISSQSGCGFGCKFCATGTKSYILCNKDAVSTVSLLWEWESRSLIHKFLKPCMI